MREVPTGLFQAESEVNPFGGFISVIQRPAKQIKLQKDMRQSYYHDHLPEASISFWNFLVRSRTSRSFDTALRPGDGVHGKIPAQVEIVS